MQVRLHIVCVTVMIVKLSLQTTGSGSSYSFRRAEQDKRFGNSDAVLGLRSRSLIQCISSCGNTQECLAFNYHKESGLCEQLNSAWKEDPSDPLMRTDPGWAYYQQAYPSNLRQVVDPCSSNPCPAGSVCVRYPQPTFHKYRYDLKFYTCSKNTWLQDEVNNGRTACKYRIVYETDYIGYDVSGYTGVMAPYQQSFDKCIDYPQCLTLLCDQFDQPNQRCWMKYTFQHPQDKIVNNPGFLMWIPECH